MQVVSNYRHKTPALVRRCCAEGRVGPSDGREEPVTGTGTGMRMGTRMGTATRTGTGTGAGIGTGMGMETEMRTGREVEGRKSRGSYETIVEVSKMEDGKEGVALTDKQ